MNFKDQNIGFLLFENFEELDIVGPWELLCMWRDYKNGPNCFTFSEDGRTIKGKKGLTFLPDYDLESAPEIDILVIPGGRGIRQAAQNMKFIHLIQNHNSHNKPILGICTGVKLLYDAGVLKGKTGTTHHLAWGDYEGITDFTLVKKRYVKDGNIWTSAGVSAGMDMSLAYIASTAGDETAGAVQYLTEYYPEGKNYPLPSVCPQL